MKVLYFGGQKSGKSRLAEIKALELSSHKPYYIATYDNSYQDSEMQKRIDRHQEQRINGFVTIEEPLALTKVIKKSNTYLVDCISMWILNTLDRDESELVEELTTICSLDANIVFVLNDVSSGVIPMDEVSRKYVDRSGVIGQRLASLCDKVYEVKLAIAIQLK